MSLNVESEGFAHAILAFSGQPELPVGENHQVPQTVANRTDSMSLARRENEAIVFILRIRRAMSSIPPNDSALTVNPGNKISVDREKGCEGPNTLFYIGMGSYRLY